MHDDNEVDCCRENTNAAAGIREMTRKAPRVTPNVQKANNGLGARYAKASILYIIASIFD